MNKKFTTCLYEHISATVACGSLVTIKDDKFNNASGGVNIKKGAHEWEQQRENKNQFPFCLHIGRRFPLHRLTTKPDDSKQIIVAPSSNENFGVTLKEAKETRTLSSQTSIPST